MTTTIARAGRGLALATALALAGCGPPAYQKAGVSPSVQARDETVCRQQANEPRESRDIVGGAGGITNYPFSNFDFGAYDSCMKERGYTRAE